MPPTRINVPTSDPKRFVSLAKAAEYLDADPRTIRRMIASGDLTGYRVGRRMLRVDLNELDATLRPIPSVRNFE